MSRPEPAIENAMLNFNLGYEPQVLEFADIKLLHNGRAVKETDLPRSGI